MLGASGERVRFGTFEVDLGAGEGRQHGAKIKLHDQPFAVLALLLERAGELVTREEFRKRIWGAEIYLDFDQALNKAVKNIRAALARNAEGVHRSLARREDLADIINFVLEELVRQRNELPTFATLLRVVQKARAR